MNRDLEDLQARLGAIDDLVCASVLLRWDEETHMPRGGAAARAEQRATVTRAAHELRTDPALGELLERLRPFEEAHHPESFEASLIRVARRDHDKGVRVPAALRADTARAASLGYAAWLHAREANDYSIMLPHLERSLELRRRYVACFEPAGDPYDIVLDDHEPGMTTAEVEAIFVRLKARLVPMIGAVAEQSPVDDSCLHGSFPRPAQRRAALAILAAFGFDRGSWQLGDTVHPFQAAMAIGDIRLTTCFDESNLHGILSCLHEFGHGLYERQLNPAYARTPLARGASYAFHESQSRLWENLVGRRLSTWTFFYPTLQAELPAQLGDVSLDAFYRALNKVQPTLRRIDADEVTYGLHIILRFELERDLLSGRLDLRDLPEAFDAKMRDYLGVVPTEVATGVLQDVHWSDMTFGYFPTYQLGNIIAVQLYDRAEADLGDLDEDFARGEFARLAEWLRSHVHAYGRVLEPKELLQRAVGSPIDPEPYLDYLERKLTTLGCRSASACKPLSQMLERPH